MACTSSPSYPSTPSYPVTDVTLSHDKADLTKVGETLQLTATVKPSYADNKTITWKSSDEKVATVDKDGKVTAVANGTATITATSADGKHSATATITVKIAPEKLTLTTENKMLTKIGDSLQITAKVEPDNAYDKLIWKSSDEKVATVDAEGKVTAVGNGEATITATTENGKFSESVTITVKLSNEPTINTITGYGAPAGSNDSATNGAYNTTLGKDASTTGTIYGIYDMAGGSYEFVMGIFADTNGKPRSGYTIGSNSGFTGMLSDGTTYTGIAFPDSKYYNLYTGSSYTGHALTETKRWYGDNDGFVSASYPWFARGGYYGAGGVTGVFYFSSHDGNYINSHSSHLVISNE